MSFARKFTDLINRKGWSHERCAREINRHLDEGYSEGSVGAWARGTNPPPLTAAVAIARAFGVDLRYLAFDEYEAPDPAKDFPLILPAPAEPAARRLHDKSPAAQARKRKA